jgi:hypothetical protein
LLGGGVGLGFSYSLDLLTPIYKLLFDMALGTQNIPNAELIFRVILASKGEPIIKLQNISFLHFAKEVLTKEEIDFITGSFGYYSELVIMNAHDAIYLMDEFDQDTVIVKYKGDEIATKIESTGTEKPMSVAIYDSDLKNKTYLYNGVSFSFVEKKRYFFPKKKEDLKNGMIVEFFNNNKWIQRQVISIESEYEKMFKLLIKYEKIRVECK